MPELALSAQEAAVAKSTAHTPEPHAFPYWPMECLLLYNEAMRDFTRYTQDLARATDPMQAARAEGAYGVRLWRDACRPTMTSRSCP